MCDRNFSSEQRARKRWKNLSEAHVTYTFEELSLFDSMVKPVYLNPSNSALTLVVHNYFVFDIVYCIRHCNS